MTKRKCTSDHAWSANNDFFQFTQEGLVRVYDQTPVPHKPNKTAIVVKQRTLKVREGFHSYQMKQEPKLRTHVAEITLKGHWLIQAGFEVGSQVTVNVQQGKLTIQIE